MLSCKYRSRRKQHRLFRVENGFEHRSERNFRLAEAHVANKQPVHNSSAFHIVFDIGNRFELVGSFLVFEIVLEFLLPHGVGTVFKSALLFALCV